MFWNTVFGTSVIGVGWSRDKKSTSDLEKIDVSKSDVVPKSTGSTTCYAWIRQTGSTIP